MLLSRGILLVGRISGPWGGTVTLSSRVVASKLHQCSTSQPVSRSLFTRSNRATGAGENVSGRVWRNGPCSKIYPTSFQKGIAVYHGSFLWYMEFIVTTSYFSRKLINSSGHSTLAS